MLWDSGPLPVDAQGAFSVSIPTEGVAAVAIYPRAFAPQIVKIADSTVPIDLGAILLEKGTIVTGRVTDKEGFGVSGTVVAIQGQGIQLNLFGMLLGMAVKTGNDGTFRFSPVKGAYRLWVSNDAPDYSRQTIVTGATPPPILPQRIEFNGADATREVIFREGDSVVVEGNVRWKDGSGAEDVEIRVATLPPNWQTGVNLGVARTDAAGHYSLRLPAGALRVILQADSQVRAPDGSYRSVEPVGHAPNDNSITIGELKSNVKDVDFVVSGKP
jgi:hypothetical protein